MNLSNLTMSGWVLFALAVMSSLGLVVNLMQLVRTGRYNKDRMALSIGFTTLYGVWLLWLVTP